MTKRQMIQEMIVGLKFIDNEKVIENRCKNTLKRIKEVYSYYQRTNKTRADKKFCIKLLIK